MSCLCLQNQRSPWYQEYNTAICKLRPDRIWNFHTLGRCNLSAFVVHAVCTQTLPYWHKEDPDWEHAHKQTSLNSRGIFFNIGPLLFDFTELIDQGFLLCQVNIKNKSFPIMARFSWELQPEQTLSLFNFSRGFLAGLQLL